VTERLVSPDWGVEGDREFRTINPGDAIDTVLTVE